jgi:hypothetical protein
MKRLATCTLGAAALIVSFFAAAPAHAQVPTCDSLGSGGNPASTVVYVQAGDTQTNLLTQLGRALRDNTSFPITLAFVTNGSCTNISATYNKTPFATGATFTYEPSAEENPTWTSGSAAITCTVGSGQLIDIGNSATFVADCPQESGSAGPGNTPPTGVHNTTGPIQAYVLAVPEVSAQTAITYEEAYYVFGFGAAGLIQPWIDVANLWIRTASKSTLLTWSANISVPPANFHGGCGSGGGVVSGCGASAQVENGLKNNASPQTAIGLLGAEVYDADRAFLNVLAFRAKGQYAAYYPDSTAISRDKKNLRDGHYTVWAPTVWMDYVQADGVTPVNTAARYVIDMIAGEPVTPATNFVANEIVANVGAVPDCAMGVQREVDGGPMSLYTPPTSCVCDYERTTTQFTTCLSCTGSGAGTCTGSGEVCRNGLCEDH